MAFKVCDECLVCYNYYVSEVGCFGAGSPCNSYVGDGDEEDDYGDNENDDEDEIDWDLD